MATIPNMTGPILTPNFDPLISIALRQQGGEPSRVLLHGDGSLEQYDSNRVNVVHFHGFWINTDTLHTTVQLNINRPKLKVSLSKILKNKTLVVLGYGGWDDVFTHALREVMEDQTANVDVLWAFYENDPIAIATKYSSLLKAVEPAIARNRFRIYGGIDCHKFLPTLKDSIQEFQSTSKPTPNVEIKNKVEVDSSKEQYQVDATAFIEQQYELSTWSVNNEPAHLFIRDVERAEIISKLGSSTSVNLCCDWGLAHAEFISSLTKDSGSPFKGARLYRLDFSNIETKEELIEQVEIDFGFGLQTLIDILPQEQNILCFDNVETNLPFDRKEELANVIGWLTNVITDYNPRCKIIICSKDRLDENVPTVFLNQLEEFDIRAYISNNSHFYTDNNEPSESVYESLIELSKGIPSALDRYIRDLEYFSIEEVQESHFSPETYKTDFDLESKYPSRLINIVDKLKDSKDSHSSRSYELLKFMCILENGDAFTNLKRAHDKFNFLPSHLKELHSLGLVETIPLNNQFLNVSKSNTEKLHILPVTVRQYVYSTLEIEEVYEIVKQLATVHLGKKWREGGFNLSTLSKSLIANDSRNIGSTNIIVLQLLRCSILFDSSREISSSLRVCEAYCQYLNRHNKHRQVLMFIAQVRAIGRDSDKILESLRLRAYEGSALRMTNQGDKAEEVLSLLYEDLNNSDSSSKVILKSVLVDLSLLYKKRKNAEQATKIASEVLKIDAKHKHARLIVALMSENKNIEEIKRLEEDFRSRKSFVV